MGHLKTLSFKSLLNGVPAVVILSTVGGLTAGQSLLVAIVLSVLAYVIGDLLVLPAAGNTVATAADAGLALFVLWALRAFGLAITWSGILYTTVALGLIEGMVFHPYLRRLAGLDAIGPRIGDRD